KTMSQNIYDLNQFSFYVPEDNKPYYMIVAQSEEEQQRLFDYVGQAHFDGFLREEFKKHPTMRIASALPIGETIKGEIVVLIIQGFVDKKEFVGGFCIVVCAPAGLGQLLADIGVEERQIKATLKKVV